MANNQAFLYTHEEGAKGLGTAAPGTAAAALNNSGQLVGDLAKGSAAPDRAFTSFNSGPLSDPNRLADPNAVWNMNRTTDVNSLGQIAAFGLNSLDVMRALSMNPTAPVDANRAVAAAGSTGGGSGVDGGDLTTMRTDLILPQPVPEPSILALAGLVAAGFTFSRRKRRPPLS